MAYAGTRKSIETQVGIIKAFAEEPFTLGNHIESLDSNPPYDWEKYKLGYEPASRRSWVIENFDIPQFDEQRVYTVLKEGDSRDPGWGDGFTKLLRVTDSGKRVVWMSDTRAEIVEHWPVIQKMRDAEPGFSIIINGLGLGMIVHAALMHGAGRIDVVEKDRDIIALVGKKFRGNDRVHIHRGDAYTFQFPPNTRWDLAWHDIWPEISAANVPQMGYLHRKYARRVGWQDSWLRDHCREARKEILEEKRIYEKLLGNNAWEIKIKKSQGRRVRKVPPPF